MPNMSEKEKLEVQINLFELQLKELRDMPRDKRPNNYNDQLYNIAKHVKKLKAELGRL